jgi:hypothetical protein
MKLGRSLNCHGDVERWSVYVIIISCHTLERGGDEDLRLADMVERIRCVSLRLNKRTKLNDFDISKLFGFDRFTAYTFYVPRT